MLSYGGSEQRLSRSESRYDILLIGGGCLGHPPRYLHKYISPRILKVRQDLFCLRVARFTQLLQDADSLFGRVRGVIGNVGRLHDLVAGLRRLGGRSVCSCDVDPPSRKRPCQHVQSVCTVICTARVSLTDSRSFSLYSPLRNRLSFNLL